MQPLAVAQVEKLRLVENTDATGLTARLPTEEAPTAANETQPAQ